MIKGRTTTFVNRNKSKLVLTRPTCLPEDRENHQESSNLLAIKPILMSRNDRADPFRIRPTSNSTKHKEKLKKGSSLPSSNKKISLNLQPNRQVLIVREENNIQICQQRLQTVHKVENILDRFLLDIENEEKFTLKEWTQKTLDLYFKDLIKLLTQENQQSKNNLFLKIQRISENLQKKIQLPTSTKESPRKGQRTLSIYRQVNILEHSLQLSKIEEKTKYSSHMEISLAKEGEKQPQSQLACFKGNNYQARSSTFLCKDQQTQKLSVSQLSLHKKIRLKVDEVFNNPNAPIAASELESFKKEHLELMTNYVNNQPNRIVQSASIHHKHIEEQMFIYADYLRTNRFGTPTYITEVNVRALDTLVAKDLKQTNQRLIQSQDQLAVKCRVMRDFVTRIREKYDGLIKEMMMVIDKKTEFCREFVSKVSKWYQNYQARSQYLSNLKEQYCEQLFLFYSELNNIPSKLEECQNQQILASLKTMKSRMAKIDRIILIGNSFY